MDTIFIEIGFSAGLLLSAFFSVKRFDVGQGALLFACGVLAFIFMVFDHGARFGNVSSIDQSAIISVTGLTVFAYVILSLKSLKIGIDEFRYVMQLGIVLFLLQVVFSLHFLVVIAMGVLAFLLMKPLFTTQVMSKVMKFMYYLTYSVMVTVVFFVLVGVDSLNQDLFALQQNIFGPLLAFVIGYSLFYYAVHICILFYIFPNKQWGESAVRLFRELPGHFHDTQYQTSLLILASVGTYTVLHLIYFFVASPMLTVVAAVPMVSYGGRVMNYFTKS